MASIEIKTSDPRMAAGIAEGANAIALRNVCAEYAKLQAVDAVRRQADDRRWKDTQEQLAQQYSVRQHGKVYNVIVSTWALIWWAIYTMGERLVERSLR